MANFYLKNWLQNTEKLYGLLGYSLPNIKKSRSLYKKTLF